MRPDSESVSEEQSLGDPIALSFPSLVSDTAGGPFPPLLDSLDLAGTIRNCVVAAQGIFAMGPRSTVWLETPSGLSGPVIRCSC